MTSGAGLEQTDREQDPAQRFFTACSTTDVQANISFTLPVINGVVYYPSGAHRSALTDWLDALAAGSAS